MTQLSSLICNAGSNQDTITPFIVRRFVCVGGGRGGRMCMVCVCGCVCVCVSSAVLTEANSRLSLRPPI